MWYSATYTKFDCHEAAKHAAIYGIRGTAERHMTTVSVIRRRITLYNKSNGIKYRSKADVKSCDVRWYLWYKNLRGLL